MFEIIIVCLALVGAAHKGRKRRRYSANFQAIPIQTALALSTLADGVVLSTVLGNFAQSAYAIRADLTWALRSHTGGEGPIMVGIASGDLSVVEIAEAEDASPTSASDYVNRERAGRPVRRVGAFNGLSTEEVLNNGKLIRTKLRWNCANGTEPVAYVRNQSGATLTTGSAVEITGMMYINWK